MPTHPNTDKLLAAAVAFMVIVLVALGYGVHRRIDDRVAWCVGHGYSYETTALRLGAPNVVCLDASRRVVVPE